MSIAPPPERQKEIDEARRRREREESEKAIKRLLITATVIRFLKFTFFFIVLGAIVGFIGNLF
jgi:hypothetical protein